MDIIKPRFYLVVFFIFLLLAYILASHINPGSYFFVFLPLLLASALFYFTRKHYKKIKSLNDAALCFSAAIVGMHRALTWVTYNNNLIDYLFDNITFNITIVALFISCLVLKGIIALYEFKN